MKVLSYIILFVLSVNVLKGQSSTVVTNTNAIENRPLTLASEEAERGTFQIVINDLNKKFELNVDDLKLIESKRDFEKDTEFLLRDEFKVVVFSKNKIKGDGFKPQEEFVIRKAK